MYVLWGGLLSQGILITCGKNWRWPSTLVSLAVKFVNMLSHTINTLLYGVHGCIRVWVDDYVCVSLPLFLLRVSAK